MKTKTILFYVGALCFCGLMAFYLLSSKPLDHANEVDGSRNGANLNRGASGTSSVGLGNSKKAPVNVAQYNLMSISALKQEFIELRKNVLLPERERERSMRFIVDELASKLSIHECIEFVSSNVGEGAFGDSLLLQVFGSSNNSLKDLFQAIDTLEGKNRKSNAFIGLLERTQELQTDDKDFQAVLTTALANGQPDIVKLACISRLNKTATEEEAKIEVDKFLTISSAWDLSHKNYLLNNISESLTKKHPFLAWSLTPSDSQITSRLFDHMLAVDKARAMGLLLKGEINQELLSRGIRYSLNHDKDLAEKWINENWELLGDKEKNSINAEKLTYKLGDLQVANYDKLLELRAQAAEIVDPSTKIKVEGQIWSKERDMVRNAVSAAPQKAIEELVSGKSQHDSYWIEEAMDVWMAKDFDNAEKWYQENWKNLPADKAQYAAASFAKQAIKTGDLDVAEQWLPYIQDPKTKARIQADVDKAMKN